jgi:hypothetical protein
MILLIYDSFVWNGFSQRARNMSVSVNGFILASLRHGSEFDPRLRARMAKVVHKNARLYASFKLLQVDYFFSRSILKILNKPNYSD